MDIGIVLLDHGSQYQNEVDRYLSDLAERSSFLLPETSRIVVAHLQFGKPDLLDAVEELAASGVREILVFPFFLLPGKHPRHDVPLLVEEVSRRHPGLSVTLAPSLGEQPWLFEMVARWIYGALPVKALQGDPDHAHPVGKKIREKSLAFARSLLGDSVTATEDAPCLREIAARVIHATGDPSMAACLRCSPRAVEAGLAALAGKKPVVVDVKMVKAGVNGEYLERSGCPLFCAVEEAGQPPDGHTRASWGMRRLGGVLDGALVAVGNAPTALLSLVEMVQEGVATPSLVIGMPVGFVKAMEAKRRLVELGIPYIVSEGTRGGSPAAAATLNCLLAMAKSKSDEVRTSCSCSAPSSSLEIRESLKGEWSG